MGKSRSGKAGTGTANLGIAGRVRWGMAGKVPLGAVPLVTSSTAAFGRQGVERAVMHVYVGLGKAGSARFGQLGRLGTAGNAG